MGIMNHCKVSLWPDRCGVPSSITSFLLPGVEVRPAILVIPGGGYGGVCERTEGSPIARRFNELGFHAFVLDYRVAPHRFPAPQQDAMRAIRWIRGNAEKLGVDPDRIAVCGFSAGGHLAASLGTICAGVDASCGDELDSISARPDALILCYPVISLEPWSHEGSGINLFGELTPANRKAGSLEKQVTSDTPPAFLWHTIGDQLVPFRNSMEFAQAMAAHSRPCELHLFPFGKHGMLLGTDTPDISSWPQLAANFLQTQFSAAALQARYTNEYQSSLLPPVSL